MTKWVLIGLCCFVSKGTASVADSGRCPWRMPFHIIIHATGAVDSVEDIVPTHGPQMHTHHVSVQRQDFDIVIDTAYHPQIKGVREVIQYSLRSDTLRFYSHFDIDSGIGFRFLPQTTSLMIAFAAGKDSILSMHYEKNDTTTYGSNHFEDDNYFSFTISSLSFDDSTIFATDTVYSDHGISIVQRKDILTYFQTRQYPTFGDFIHASFLGSAADLGGLFRPAHFSNAAKVATICPGHSFWIGSSEQGLHCEFDASQHTRMLQIFSSLGVEVGEYPIVSGETHRIISQPVPGLYFVRLGDDIQKLYVGIK